MANDYRDAPNMAPNAQQEYGHDGVDGRGMGGAVREPMRPNPPYTAETATQATVPVVPVGTSAAPPPPVGRAVPPPVPGETTQTTVVPAQDRVRWGPVWAGLLTALTVFLVLELLAYGVGLLTTTSGGSVTASGASPWITGVLGLIAFFVGGWLAERSSAARGGDAGLLNGFMVWALGTGLILVLSVFGLGSLFGALGNAIGQLLASGGQVSGPGNVNPMRVAAITQAAALGAFFSLLLSAIAAALGGLAGSVGNATGHMRRSRRMWQR